VIARIASWLAAAAERWVPSAFAIAVLLTGIVVAGALGTGASPGAVLMAWGRGFWTLSGFAMQMSLVVLTGYLVSTAPIVDRAFRLVAGTASSPRGAAVLMAVTSMLLAWVHWGLSLVGCAMLVRHVARAQPGVDFRLLVTAAYLGMGTTWHAGLSGSVPLLMASGLIPLASTTFAPFNLTLAAVVFVVMAGVVWRMHPDPHQAVRVSPADLEALEGFEPPARPAARTFAAWCDHAPWPAWTLGAAGLAWLGGHVAGGGSLTLDVLNFTFLMAAVVLHGRLASVMAAAERGAHLLAGVVVQFPLYAGMYGVIEGTGLARVLGDAIARTATAETLPLALYWYSSVLNYFVPSGGSKWAVEAPFILEAARRLDVGLDRVVLAYAWGDMASNLIQPFWALPLLAAARLGFRDIMGYAALAFALITVIVSTAFWLWP
jgi:short-chain fatty acids transporter